VLRLYIEAPFAAFRTFAAGGYRPTATFLTPSAAYGLVLNVAGIESRLWEEHEQFPQKHPYNPRRNPPLHTLVVSGLPVVDMALGVATFRLRGRDRRELVPEADQFPRVQTVYQQLHNYPVGGTGKKRAEETKENKYHITPVRREFLSDLRAVIALRGNNDLEDRIRRGLANTFNAGRYGVPFLGDNAFLIDRLEELTDPGPVRWYERISAASGAGVRDRATRLTILIDRADLSKTESAVFAPTEPTPADKPPPSAWVEIKPPQPEVTPPTPSPRRRSPKK